VHYPGNPFRIEIDTVAFHQPQIAFSEAQHFNAEPQSSPHGASYTGIHAGTVASAGKYSDSFHLLFPLTLDYSF
jgi:hypothetical protein